MEKEVWEKKKLTELWKNQKIGNLHIRGKLLKENVIISHLNPFLMKMNLVLLIW